MLAYGMHLLRTVPKLQKVDLHPDGDHGKRFEIVQWLSAQGFLLREPQGKTAYCGTYKSERQTIVVTSTPGKGDVVATTDEGIIVAECKGGIVNTAHAGQTSRLRKGLCEAVGLLIPTDRREASRGCPAHGDAAERRLRQRLEEMTHVDDVSRHPVLLAALTRERPNTVALLDSAHPIRRYTCLMHVFDFAEKPEYAAIATHGLGRIYAAGAFAHWLLDRGLLVEVTHTDVREGDLVFYFSDDGRFKHAGLCQTKGRVMSKWGIGHLYEHGVFEVPDSYGDKVRLFRNLSYEEAFGHFMRFAEDNGMVS
jgi:hypothetical protein